eukprot:snap_masked-scaffold_6-processed-gene-8.17-mRNA-1 protein AED:0.08 eAED:0.09 QI:0/-1/0/1/-1/1/1/0/260
MAMRKVFIGGNWKCNGTLEKIRSLVKMLNEAAAFPQNCEVVVSPTALHVSEVCSSIDKTRVQVAVQNIYTESKAGAFTGELTPDLVKDVGAEWVVLGHSERRSLPGLTESPDFVAAKCKTAVESGLKVIACIGETLAQRESGETLNVCKEQMEPIFDAVGKDYLKDIVLAYEPVWAIGTGKVATPEQAQETHAQLREYLREKISPEEAEKMRIIYGGSVKGSNCESLMIGADIDGFLVGGASLKEEFLDIIQSSALKAKI